MNIDNFIQILISLSKIIVIMMGNFQINVRTANQVQAIGEFNSNLEKPKIDIMGIGHESPITILHTV